MPNVTLRLGTTVSGVYDHGYVLADEHVGETTPGDGRPKQRLWRIRAGQIITATGAIERPLSFAGNDVPGVMLAASLRDYLHDYAVSPGDRTVVVTNNDDAYLTAIALKEAGLSVPLIVDARRTLTGPLPQPLATGVNLAFLPQAWRMFGTVRDQEQWVSCRMTLVDGRVIDPLREGRPAPPWTASRRLRLAAQSPLAPLPLAAPGA